MYESRFGLHRKPFFPVLAEDAVFTTEFTAELKSSLLHALKSDLGIAVLTGPPGVGKSVLLHDLQRTLVTDGVAVLLNGGTLKSSGDLYFQLHHNLLKHSPKAALTDCDQTVCIERTLVVEHLQRATELWGPTQLLIDDAHVTADEVLQELRILLDMNADGRAFFKLLIAGNLTLEDKLNRPALTDFSQRIRTHSFVQKLTTAESVDYLRHQLQRVGGALETVCQTHATEQIVAAAEGVPRCLDLLVDECFVIADRHQQNTITVDIVKAALQNLQHLPYTWNTNVLVDSTATEDAASVQSTTVVSEGVVEIGHFDDALPESNISTEEAVVTTIETSAVEPVEENHNADSAEAAGCCNREADQTDVIEFGGEQHAELSDSLVDLVDAVQVTEERFFEIAGETTLSAEDDAVLFDDFQGWQPAGDWPAKFANLADQTVPANVVDTESTDEQTAGTVDDFVGIDFQTTPVVDRFTWNQLDRQVIDEPSPTIEFEVAQTENSWPPVTHGIAPVAEIPMMSMDDEYSEMLEDLRIIMRSAAEGRENASSFNHPTDIAAGSVVSSEHMPLQAIDQLEDLIQQDSIPQDSQTDADSSPTKLLTGPANDSVKNLLSNQLSRLIQRDITESVDGETSAEETSDAIENRTADTELLNEREPQVHDSSLRFSLPLSDEPETTTQFTELLDDDSVEAEDESGIQYRLIPLRRKSAESQQAIRLTYRDEQSISHEESDQEEEQRLGIQIHPLRVTHVTSLRKAAGAESYSHYHEDSACSDADAESETVNDVSEQLPQIEKSPTETPANSRRDFGFSTLFTRLRTKR